MSNHPGQPRFEWAMAQLDEANGEDPTRIQFEGESHPKELLHARRASHWLAKLRPEASEALRLAVRAHHLKRWMWPRSGYPAGRAGYHAWRRTLQDRHAEAAGEILRAAGYSAEQVDRVGELLHKRGLGEDPETQAYEDALCLVFVEMQLADFAKEHEPEKVVRIVARTLPKMSDQAKALATTIARSTGTLDLIERAVRLSIEPPAQTS